MATVDAEAPAKAEGGEAPKKAAKARIVVVGTADFASNQFLGAQGNRDFFLNVVSWLAEEEDLISIRAKDPKQNPVVLTSAQSRLVWGLPLVGLPGAVPNRGLVEDRAQRRRARLAHIPRADDPRPRLILAAGLGGFFYYDTYSPAAGRGRRSLAAGRIWTVEPRDVERVAVAREGERYGSSAPRTGLGDARAESRRGVIAGRSTTW